MRKILVLFLMMVCMPVYANETTSTVIEKLPIFYTLGRLLGFLAGLFIIYSLFYCLFTYILKPLYKYTCKIGLFKFYTVIILIMCLYVPWIDDGDNDGYDFIFASRDYGHIDFNRIILEIFIISIIFLMFNIKKINITDIKNFFLEKKNN